MDRGCVDRIGTRCDDEGEVKRGKRRSRTNISTCRPREPKKRNQRTQVSTPDVPSYVIDAYNSRRNPSSLRIDFFDLLQPLRQRPRGPFPADAFQDPPHEQDLSLLDDLVTVIIPCPDGRILDQDCLGSRDEAVALSSLMKVGRRTGDERVLLAKLQALNDVRRERRRSWGREGPGSDV